MSTGANTVIVGANTTVLGDLGPTLSLQLLNNGAPITINTGTDTFAINYVGLDGVPRTKALTILDASSGLCEVSWVAGDLPVIGSYRGQVKMTREGDTTFPQSFPNEGNFIRWFVYQTIPAGGGGNPILGVTYYPFQPVDTNPIPANTPNYIWVDSDGTLRLTANGVTTTMSTTQSGGGSGATVFNVMMYGATGDGTTDDGNAIRAAMAAASQAGGATVYFPNGTYIVSLPESPGPNQACLDIPSNVTLRGESTVGAIIKMAAGQAHFTRVVSIGSMNARISTLTIDGNGANQENVDDDGEHRAGVILYQCSFVVLEDLIIQNCTGDGVCLSASSSTVIQRCQIYGCDRGGITMDSGTTYYLAVRDCYIAGNANQFHIETSDNILTVRYLWLEDTYLGPGGDYQEISCSIGQITEDAWLRGLVIMGCLGIASCTRLVVSDCYIETGSMNPGVNPVAISAGAVDIVIRNCTIRQTGEQSPESDDVVQIFGATSRGVFPTRITIEDNLIIADNPASNGVRVQNTSEVWVTNNRIENTAATNTGVGVIDFASDTGNGNVYIRGNHLLNWSTGILAGINSVGLYLGALTIIDNFIEIPQGSPMTPSAYNLSLGAVGPSQCQMSGNELQNVSTVWVSYPLCPILIGGSRGAGGIYSITGSPQGVLTEVIGAMALRMDGAANTTLYVNTSGGISGWTAVSSS